MLRPAFTDEDMLEIIRKQIPLDMFNQLITLYRCETYADIRECWKRAIQVEQMQRATKESLAPSTTDNSIGEKLLKNINMDIPNNPIVAPMNFIDSIHAESSFTVNTENNTPTFNECMYCSEPSGSQTLCNICTDIDWDSNPEEACDDLCCILCEEYGEEATFNQITADVGAAITATCSHCNKKGLFVEIVLFLVELENLL